MFHRRLPSITLAALTLGAGAGAWAQSAPNSDANLAKELQNPVADLISVPVESRIDMGSGSLHRLNVTVMPVYPMQLTSNLMVVSRTVLPMVHDTGNATPGQGSLSGLGDATQSFFFAPKEPMGNWIIGAGPVLRLPTATQRDLGMGVWGAGPTLVVLNQGESWTYGFLTNHIRSFAGRTGSKFNGTYFQPFLAYTTPSLLTLGVGSESAFDWVTKTWIVPIDVNASKLIRVGQTPLNLSLGLRKYVTRPVGSSDWAALFTVTFMFPK